MRMRGGGRGEMRMRGGGRGATPYGGEFRGRGDANYRGEFRGRGTEGGRGDAHYRGDYRGRGRGEAGIERDERPRERDGMRMEGESTVPTEFNIVERRGGRGMDGPSRGFRGGNRGRGGFRGGEEGENNSD